MVIKAQPLPLTPDIGKTRGLERLFGCGGLACVLAIDHGQSFRSRLEWMLGRAPSEDDVAREKRRILRYLAPEASGVVCDPEIGLGLALTEGLVPKDKAVIAGLADVPLHWREADGWPWPDFSVADAKLAGCDAVKVCVLAAADGAGAEKVRLADTVGQLCHDHQIAYVLEVVAGEAYPARSGMRLRSVQRERASAYVEEFSGSGADLFKLRLPAAVLDVASDESGDAVLAAACREITRESPSPWALLSAGTRFEVFERDFEVACRSGASGFVAGTAVWQEALEIRDPHRRDEFLAEVSAGRLSRLRHIALAYGRPASPTRGSSARHSGRRAE